MYQWQKYCRLQGKIIIIFLILESNFLKFVQMTSSLSQIQIFQRQPITIYSMFTNQSNTQHYGLQNNHKNPSQNLQPSNYNNLYYQQKQPNTNIDLQHPQTKSVQELIQTARKIYGKNRLSYQRQTKTGHINNNKYFKAQATADNYPYNKSNEKAYLNQLDSKQFLESTKKPVSNFLPYMPHQSKKIPETAPNTTQILPKIQSHAQQNILDFLYKFFGILSCHIRLKQRYVLYRLIEKSQQLKPVKNFNKLFTNTHRIFNRRLQNVFSILKNLKINNHLYINNNMKNKQDYKKITRLDQQYDSNFIMLESEVEKGLKYLEQRSDRRQKETLKYNRSGNNFQKQQKYNEYHDKKYQYNVSDPYSVNNKNIVSKPNIQNSYPTLKFNNKKIQGSQNIKVAQSATFSKENKTEENFLQNQDIYLRLQRESKINSYRTPQWLALELNDQPLDYKNKKQLFSRVELNQRKYYLNPNLFIGSQPDTNDFIMPLQLNQEYQLHGIQTSLYAYKKLTQMTTQPNIPQDNIFISYTNNIQNFKQQNYQFKKQSDKNQGKLTNIKYDNHSLIKNQLNQQEFDNLPSFAQKNKAMMKNLRYNQIKKDVFQNQHTKSDQMGNKIIDKQQQNSFKISEGEDPDHLNDCLLVDSDRKKINKIQQYYTDNNIKSQKNKGARVTIQFSKPRKTKKTTARPKSMTTSLKQQLKVTQENPLYKSIQQNAKVVQQSAQQTPMTTNKTQTQQANSPNFCKNKLHIDQKSSANIKIITPISSSFSPKYQTNINFSNKKFIINNEYGNLQQTKFVPHHQPIQPDINQHQAILNKPARSVSSEARFVHVYGNPIKYSPYNHQKLQNNIIQQPRPQIIQNHPRQIHYVNNPTNNIGYAYRIQRDYPYFPNPQHPQQYFQHAQQNPQISYKPFTPTTLTQTRPPAISLMHQNQRSPCQSKINKKRKGIEVKSIQKQLLCSKSQKTLQRSTINTQKASQGQMVRSITNLRKIKLVDSQYS